MDTYNGIKKRYVGFGTENVSKPSSHKLISIVCVQSCFPTPVQGCIQEECDTKGTAYNFFWVGGGWGEVGGGGEVAVGVTQKNPCINFSF